MDKKTAIELLSSDDASKKPQQEIKQALKFLSNTALRPPVIGPQDEQPPTPWWKFWA